jgi:hypothetical protein
MNSARAGLIGTWALVATGWKRADGRHANPFGDGATGVLMYDAAGYVAAQVMRAGRPQPPPDAHAGLDTAMAASHPGYIAYFGTYEVEASGEAVQHQVIGATMPAWVGATLRRRFRIEGDELTLTDDVVASDGVAVVASMTWRRVATSP